MPNQQRTLFDVGPPPVEVEDSSLRRIASIVFSSGPAKEFDYLVPDALGEKVEVGRRVRVPFGAGDRLVVGYCVRVQTRPVGRRRLKPIREVVDARTLLPPAMLQLTHWIADHYLCDWGQVLEAVVPAGVRIQAGTRPAVLLTLAAEASGHISELHLPPKQAAVLKVLAASPEPMLLAEVMRAAKCTQAPISGLRRKGLVQARTGRIAQRRASDAAIVRQQPLRLNPDQQQALNTILEMLRSGNQQTVLIHGVTGSGKTEVYIQAIERVVAAGRQAIVLVPEISLTPQTVERFRQRFDGVAVLHSNLSDADRHWHWQQIAEGAIQVVVGARSAIFAPTPRLGLVVLDEEHETSFKQETAPRYHARDVAIARAKIERVPLVLGSATPSLESWHRAQTGEYRLVEMPRRVLDRPLPNVGTVDLRDEVHRRRSAGAIARPLHIAIRAALEQDGQVISPFVLV